MCTNACGKEATTTPNLRAVICAVVSAAVLIALLPVQAQSPQEILNQYISDLQKNPNDNALREKIIRLGRDGPAGCRLDCTLHFFFSTRSQCLHSAQ